MMNGGELLVAQLQAYGVRRVFMVPGESFLPCIDALYGRRDVIESVVCRQEGGAAYMAEAHGKLTGEPGICFVSRGPGATNAAIGVHTAREDSTPMILFIGQVGTDTVDRQCFQEVDYRAMYAPLAKWVAQIERADRIPEYIARAWAIATSGRPGPVVLALPDDMLAQTVDAPLAPLPRASQGSPASNDMVRLRELIESAERPLLLLGGARWSDSERDTIREFAERFDLPVATAWRRLELFDNDHPNFVGQVSASMPAHQKDVVTQSDLVIALGTRLCEPTTINYQWLASPVPKQTLVHIYPDANEIGRLCVPALGIVASVSGFADAVQTLHPTAGWQPRRRGSQAMQAAAEMPPMPGPLDLNIAARHVASTLPANACVTVGAGNYALYAHRHIAFKGLGSQLAPAVGAMGYGLPAAIAAKLNKRDAAVICFAGDGCFQMTMQEVGTAAQYRLGIVILVFNNGLFGTIRLHQERAYPGRPLGTDLVNPDFAVLAQSYGGFGRVITRTEDFAAAYDAALAFAQRENMPAILDLRYDADLILPDRTLTQIRKTS
ncbi:thiamine pyrophosphate-dependent enzyme [Bordetella sp. 02P26C-1]|uniref:thiamine pyrophosphate-dependent enzyme n=1 Tax=Bordetella sp. 02P26C-1 TaxID=2683195 RepID=UPI0013548D5E|nr:thiamine pyrophosphate-dependent enzyme [Bordetella sp. 02P26C-1]MVW80504.1 thiamine pyrophosphate-binding protein [Bordetella sp. 02P26C-1]